MYEILPSNVPCHAYSLLTLHTSCHTLPYTYCNNTPSGINTYSLLLLGRSSSDWQNYYTYFLIIQEKMNYSLRFIYSSYQVHHIKYFITTVRKYNVNKGIWYRVIAAVSCPHTLLILKSVPLISTPMQITVTHIKPPWLSCELVRANSNSNLIKYR